MMNLSETWFVEGNIDFESKKYLLLAYLQQISTQFNEQKLYPHLADAIFHYNNIVAFKENKRFLQQQFPKRLTGIQIQKLEILYEEMIADDELMSELEDITLYASHKIKKTIDMGTEIYHQVEENMSITPIGILPFQNTEGYFLLSHEGYRYTRVYHYYLSIFEKQHDKYRAIKSRFINEWERNFVNSYENIKVDLMKMNTTLPVPAVYAIEVKTPFPMEETLLPIAKRSLVRFLSNVKH